MPTLVVTEVVYSLESRFDPEAEVRFLGDLAAGNLLAEPVAAECWLRMAHLVSTYRDLPFDVVDASVVAVPSVARSLGS